MGLAWTRGTAAKVHPAGLIDVWFYIREVLNLAGSSTQPYSGDPRSVVAGDLLGLLAVLWRNSGTQRVEARSLVPLPSV